MDCGMVGDVHPKEMIIDNISSQQCNEAYTFIKLPASASSKGTASVHVKIDTGSGGNILPSICSNSCIQNKLAQMACPLAWTLYKPS